MNKLKTIIFILILSYFSTPLQAQETKQPLAMVLKRIATRHHISFSFANNTIKNKQLTPPSKDLTLTATLAYLRKKTALSFQQLNKTTIVIALRSIENNTFSEVLDEIFVVNYLSKGMTLSNTGSVLLKQEEFDILPGLIAPDVFQSMQVLPGITSVDETAVHLNIRGGTPDQNLILWDGIRMYQTGHFFGLISAFNPYSTKRVEVAKNGTSAAFGGGISSTMDIQLDNRMATDFKSEAGLNFLHGNLFFKLPVSKKVALQIAARRSTTDLVSTPTYKQYYKRIFQDTDIVNQQHGETSSNTSKGDFYFYDFEGKIHYELTNKDLLSVAFLKIYNDLNYLETFENNETTSNSFSGITQKSFASSFSYKREWNSRFTSKVKATLSKYNVAATNHDLSNNQRLIQENTVLDTGLQVNTQYRFSTSTTWENGYQFSEIGIASLQDVDNPLYRSYIKEVLRNHTLYSQIHYTSSNKKTSARIGFRGTYFNKLNTFLPEPRVSVSQRFLKHFKLALLGELKSQSVSKIIDLQNDFLGIEKHRWTLANNSNTPLIKSKQVSLGLDYNNNNLLIRSEFFFKKASNINARSQNFQNQYQYATALGSYQIKGFDFLIHKRLQQFSSWLSYSLSKNNYTFKELNNGNPFANNVDLRHVLHFANSYTFKNVTFSIGVNWHTGKPTTLLADTLSEPNEPLHYQAPNSSNLSDYTRIDFSSTYRFHIHQKTTGIVGVSFWNLLDTKNILNQYYTRKNDVISSVTKKSLGFTPNVNFRIHF